MKKRRKKNRSILKPLILGLVILVLGFAYINIKYPIGYTSLIKEYSNKYNLDPFLVAAIINVESSYDKDAISPKSAKGLMQISPQTGQWIGEELALSDYSEEKLFLPEINIMMGTWYLNRLSRQYEDNLDHVLIAYNAGSGNLKKWLENEEYCKDGENISKIPFKETEEYLVKVRHNIRIYKVLYKNKFDKLESDDFYLGLANNMRSIIKQIIK